MGTGRRWTSETTQSTPASWRTSTPSCSGRRCNKASSYLIMKLHPSVHLRDRGLARHYLGPRGEGSQLTSTSTTSAGGAQVEEYNSNCISVHAISIDDGNVKLCWLISSVMCKYKQCLHRLPADSLVFLGHCQLSLALTRTRPSAARPPGTS